MIENPEADIGLPANTAEDFLFHALERFPPRKLRDFELIISDNASTDGPREICEVPFPPCSRISQRGEGKASGRRVRIAVDQ